MNTFISFIGTILPPIFAFLQKMLSITTKNIKVVVLTGGPCAGKTTAMEHIRRYSSQRGWFVVVVPEAATIVREMGFKVEKGIIPSIPGQLLIVMTNIWNYITAITGVLNCTSDKILMIQDRCAIDGAAYVPLFDDFSRLLQGIKIAHTDVANACVFIHLQSLAVDNPDLYEQLKAGNPTRFENAAEAAETDRRTIAAYEHFGFNVKVIGNAGGIEIKTTKLLNVIANAIGEPEIRKVSEFIVKMPLGDLSCVQLGQSMEITQFYFITTGVRYRLIKNASGGVEYTRAIKIVIDDAGSTFVYSHPVSKDEYDLALDHSDRSPRIICKTRQEFSFVDSIGITQRGIIDTYPDGQAGNACRVEIEYVGDQRDLPSFFQDNEYSEVTGDIAYSNLAIATGSFSKLWINPVA